MREGSTYYTRGAAGLISKKSGANVDYYYTDYHGSVVRCGDEAYSYDAFGNQTEASGGTNPFRYSGEYYDEETGLIYLRARYYDSGVGGFISEDPARDGLNWYSYCAGNPVNFWDPTGLASYVVVLAAGINSNSSSDYFYWLKNEIQYRMNTQGDTVRFLEVYPYGEVDGANFVKQITQVSGQASQVLSDANYKTRAGADYVNWKITEASVQEDETIIMIGHSGGGTAITGAYYYMDDKHKQKVSQIVTIGSPQMMILSKSQQAKTTRITDNNDIIPKIGNDFGAFANYRYTVNNGYNNEIQAHVTYFNTAQKSANILNFFWERAMRW